MSIAGAVICRNELDFIDECLKNLAGICDKIYVLDGGSTDGTFEFLKNQRDLSIQGMPPIVLRKKVTDPTHFGDQRNALLSIIDEEWVLFLDADEIVTEYLRDELKRVVEEKQGYDAVDMPRINLIDGKDTGVYPDYQRRFFRNFCRFIYPVHEELVGCRKVYRATSVLIHAKSSLRQDTQNSRYDNLIERTSGYRFRRDHEH